MHYTSPKRFQTKPADLLLLFFVVLMLSRCGQPQESIHAPAPTDTVDAASTKPTTKNPNLDTIYSFQQNGKAYQLVFIHNEVMSYNREQDETVTVHLVATDTHDTVFQQTYDFNTVGTLHHVAPNQFWLELINFGGGSGYSGTLYKIKTTPKPTLQALVNINELSSWKNSRDATQILFAQALWDMSDPDGDIESHFEEHKQSLALYTIEADTVVYNELGTTTRKYDFSEKQNEFEAIRAQEAGLVEAVDWGAFDFGKEK